MIKWKKDIVFGVVVSKRCHIGPFLVLIHRNIFGNPFSWYVSTSPDVLCTAPLASKDIDEAGCQAVSKLQVVFQDAINEITGEE